ncbi:MAG: S8 family serine peptidase [Hyphomicrobiales bacterium]|nr:S8 family serine peptidase [Hyphomicrobiales bacterium]
MRAIAEDIRVTSRPRRRWARAALAVALAVTVPATEVSAQTAYRGQTPSGDVYRPTRRGGGGVGVGTAIGIGVGLGLLIGQGMARSRAEEDAPPPRRRRTVEPDEDAPIKPRTRSGDAPPKKRTPVATAAPTPAITVPPPSETRFMPGEILVELREGGSIEAIARRRDLAVVDSRPIRLIDTTLYRLRTRGNQSVAATLRRLQRERTIAHAEPNWVYTLQEEGVPAASGEAVPPTPNAVPATPSETATPVATSPAVEEAAPASATAAAATTPVAEAAPLPGQWGGERIHLGAAHARASGRGVRVAVIDTAADGAHPELAGAIEATFDALPGVDPSPGAHGTAMAGAAAARLRLAGAAPAARVLAARAFGPPGADGTARGATYEVVACLDWAVEHEARVVSMSFAGPGSGVLARALAAARAKGVVLVAAAGNAGPKSEPLFPAADAGVVAVTASDPDDRILPQAVRGRHVAVTAPGVDVLVPTPKGGYDLTSGTSVATAEVAGVVALLLERRPELRPDEVARLIGETAVDLGAPGRDPVFGAGLIDAEAALARLR